MPRSNRSGAETRAAVQRAALRLFSEHGYEATSLRDIAAEVGINKASLYYYFPSKEDILRSVLEARSTEARDLMTWLEHEPRTPDLAERAVLRWVDAFTAEKLHGIRFMNGNPRVFRALAATTGVDLGDELAGLLRFFGDAEPEQQLLLRMAFMSIGTAVAAAEGVAGATDEVAIRAARSAARALIAAARAA